MTMPASGSYAPDDVRFLLTEVAIADTPVADKETLIQSGRKHYSEMLTHEAPPAADYVALFHAAMTANRTRVAADVLTLAERIVATRPDGITLVSLARAGTPVGVLLKRVLQRDYRIDAMHYSVSILRDLGLDANALRYIIARHAPETLVFIDGWTGKGVIARQLEDSLARFAGSDGVAIAAELYVLADLSGAAAVAASTDDYLIPSCILNATVSGLISRSIYHPSLLGDSDFHGCVYYHHLKPYDLSRYFVEHIIAASDRLQPGAASDAADRAARQHHAQTGLRQLTERYRVGHPHYLKPGIGEATRVLLRREARLLLLRDADAAATQHLRWLAQSKAVPIEICATLPYHAVAFIKEQPL